MSLLVVATVALAYLCVVAFVMALLASAKRADGAEQAYRALGGRDARWDDRLMAAEEVRPRRSPFASGPADRFAGRRAMCAAPALGPLGGCSPERPGSRRARAGELPRSGDR